LHRACGGAQGLTEGPNAELGENVVATLESGFAGVVRETLECVLEYGCGVGWVSVVTGKRGEGEVRGGRRVEAGQWWQG
jgi:hypothetical protein